jgi:predicted MFS family arabinose efflux permease
LSSEASGPEHSEPPRESPRLIAAVTGTWTVSLLAYYAQAQLLGPIMRQFEQGEQAVGWLFSLETTALALTSLAAAGPLARWSRSRAALLGGTVVVAANIVSAFAGSFEILVVARLLAGAAAGLTGAAGVAAAAGTRDPDRIFATVTFTWGLLASAPPSFIPYATVPFGATGGFLALAGMSLVLVPLLGWLPPPRAAPGDKPSLLAAPNRALALAAMLALLVFEVGQGGVYTFIEQIGLRAQMDEYAIGRTLTGTGLAGLSGAALAAWLGSRYGRRWPIAIGITLNIVAAVWLTVGHDPASFVAMNLLWNAAYYFVVPYLMGAMAALDDLGRWVVAMDAVWTLGDGLGPGVAGSMVGRGGLEALLGLPLFTGLVCLVVILGVARRIDTHHASMRQREAAT